MPTHANGFRASISAKTAHDSMAVPTSWSTMPPRVVRYGCGYVAKSLGRAIFSKEQNPAQTPRRRYPKSANQATVQIESAEKWGVCVCEGGRWALVQGDAEEADRAKANA